MLTKNMHRFKTKNLNEGRVTGYDEKSMRMMVTYTVYDAIIPGGGTALESMQDAEKYNSRLMTKEEMANYMKMMGGAYNEEPDDRLPANLQQWRAFIIDKANDPAGENPILWDLAENEEAPRAMPATRLIVIAK